MATKKEKVTPKKRVTKKKIARKDANSDYVTYDIFSQLLDAVMLLTDRVFAIEKDHKEKLILIAEKHNALAVRFIEREMEDAGK